MTETHTAPDRPTLERIRAWPPAVDVTDAAMALGVSRSGLYQAIADGACPVQTIVVGHRRKVLTHSLIAVLEGRDTAARSA
jgi:hypothetical protein